MQCSVNFGLGAKKIFLTEDHWLVVEAQSSSFLSSRTLSDICPLHRCFLPTAPFEWICQTKKNRSQVLALCNSMTSKLKTWNTFLPLAVFSLWTLSVLWSLEAIFGPVKYFGCIWAVWHFWALRGRYGNLLVSSSSIFRAKCTYLGGS